MSGDSTNSFMNSFNNLSVDGATEVEMTNEIDIFISGETIDLCVPPSNGPLLAAWCQWFNDPKVTKYLHQGVYPNTTSAQEKYAEDLQDNKDRIVLMLRPKGKNFFVGVCALSYIDLISGHCDFALVIGKHLENADALFYGMEAKSMMTEHAFEKLGMHRVNSTQVIDLIKWQRWQILFGYQIEGIQRAKFKKGLQVSDVLVSACLLEDYLHIKQKRNGIFWPGKAKIYELLKVLPKKTLIDDLIEWLPLKQDEYFKSVTYN